jgi:DNA polymerase-3 subunit epsilon
MNAGVRIPPFITQLTGITNAMVADAPPAAEVMAQARQFVGDVPLVAHNAPFDRGFWQAELARAGCDAPQPFACTVRLSRRLYPEAPNHQLGTLARFHRLPSAGRAHRALADAQVTAALLLRIQQDLGERWGVAAPGHDFLMALQACAKARLPGFLAQHGAAQALRR